MIVRLAFAAIVSVMLVPAGAQAPQSRAEAVKIVADMRRIVTPSGIDRVEAVRIGGIDQWISVRGVDRRNPILLMIHGGPGYVSMPTSWYFQRGWEDYFTVVQWDQRGAGKTYAANDPAAVAPTMKRARMIADAEEMLEWLRLEFGKRRIFVLGHSWGSSLGIELARRHPDKLHAYIGAGQITNSPESERRGLRFALQAARRDNNLQAVRELEALGDYAAPGTPIKLADLYVQRKWLGHYGGAVAGRRNFNHEGAAARLAPEYSDAELGTLWKANDFSAEHLLAETVSLDFSTYTKFACPIIVLNGRHDYNVSASAAEQWFRTVNAPFKKLVWFEHSAHEMFNEEPGKMLMALVRHARPFAEKARDAAP